MESEAMFFDSLGVSLYADMTVGYSLRVLKSWEWACLSLVRSTDSAVAYIYFDDNDVISLNSLISTVGAEETPSATTLGTWIGTANADIGNLYGQTANGVFDSGFTLTSELTSRRPLFIENGIIKTNNGVASMYFDATKSFIKANSLGVTALDSGNPFTVLSVSANEVIAGLGTVFCTNKISSNRVLQFQDRRTVKRATFIKTLSGDYAADLSAQQDSGNTRLLTTVMDNSKNFDSYFNATFQTSNTYLGDYANNNLVVGSQFDNKTPLTGYISEIIIFPTDKTSDLTELHNDINNYYTIYSTAAIPLENIISEYKFQNNTLDTVGSNDGVNSGGVYVDGLVGKSIEFENNKFASVSGASNLTFPLIPFSCTFLVKWNIGAFRNWLVSKRDFSTSQIEYQIDYFSGQLQVGLFNTDNSGSIRKEYNWIPTVGQWYHITVTYDGTALQSSLGLYIDAVSIGATREVGTFTGMTLGTSRVLFGKAGFNSTYYLTGELDCIRFWDKELTSDEVSSIATAELNGIDINP